MSIRKSVLMLQGASFDGEMKIVGERVRADNFFGFTDGIHTVSMSYYNFKGYFMLQGTLSMNPEESDWFNIDVTERNRRTTVLRFPEDPAHPTGEKNGDTGTNAFTFIGNFTYLRAVVSWEGYIPPPVLVTNEDMGSVDKVLLAM